MYVFVACYYSNSVQISSCKCQLYVATCGRKNILYKVCRYVGKRIVKVPDGIFGGYIKQWDKKLYV